MRLLRPCNRHRLALSATLVAALLTQGVGQYLHLSGHDHTGVGTTAEVIEGHHHGSHACAEHSAPRFLAATQHRVDKGCDHEASHAERCVLSWLWYQSFEPDAGATTISTLLDAVRRMPPRAEDPRTSLSLFRLAPKQSPPHLA